MVKFQVCWEPDAAGQITQVVGMLGWGRGRVVIRTALNEAGSEVCSPNSAYENTFYLSAGVLHANNNGKEIRITVGYLFMQCRNKFSVYVFNYCVRKLTIHVTKLTSHVTNRIIYWLLLITKQRMQSLYRREQVLRVRGGWGSQMSRQSAH
jgi:hypothetical protein